MGSEHRSRRRLEEEGGGGVTARDLKGREERGTRERKEKDECDYR